MSSRLSETIASLHETRSVNLNLAGIDAEGAAALADALKANTSVTHITLEDNLQLKTMVNRRLLTH
jgi:hypothetical protein